VRNLCHSALDIGQDDIQIRMKLMTVIHNLKNIMNQEFQHWMESQLIEVMKMKMQMKQFVSIVNLIQMKIA
jgi:hypothetical protein